MTVLHPVFGTPVPDEWEVSTVDDIKSPEKSSCVAGPFGSNISSKFFVADGVPVIRGSNLTDDLTQFVGEHFVFVSTDQAQSYVAQHVVAGDLVFTCWGTIGQVGLIPRDGPYSAYIISNKQLKLRPDPLVADSAFLFHYFASPKMVEYIRNRAIGSAVPGINLGILKGLPVVLPPLAIQRKIVAVLSTYEDLIENNNRRIKVLEEIAQRIYREWFVDFRYPGHEDVPMVDSELGPIPQGWEVAPLASLASVVMGQSPPSSAYNMDRGGLPFHQGVGSYGLHFPVHTVYSTVGNRFAEDGDVLVSVRAPVGRINVADRKMILGRGLAGVRANVAPSTFVLEALQYFFREEDVLGNGAIFKSVTRRDVEGLPLVWPGTSLATEFSHHVAPMRNALKLFTTEVTNLRMTRDLLLMRLISGEIDITDLDIAMPEVAA